MTKQKTGEKLRFAPTLGTTYTKQAVTRVLAWHTVGSLLVVISKTKARELDLVEGWPGDVLGL